MIDVQLISSSTKENTLRECLEKRGFSTGDHGMFSLVERGEVQPDMGLAVIFDGSNLDELMAFLDIYADRKKEGCTDLIIAKKDENYYPLHYSVINYFFSKGNSVFCRIEKEQYEVPRKLYEIETILSSKGFFRIGKSVIVNVVSISEIIPWFGGRLLLKLKGRSEELEVSRNYVCDFKEFLGI